MTAWKTWVEVVASYLFIGCLVLGFVRGLQQKPVTFTDVTLWVIVLPWEGGNFIRENIKANQQQVYPYR